MAEICNLIVNYKHENNGKFMKQTKRILLLIVLSNFMSMNLFAQEIPYDLIQKLEFIPFMEGYPEEKMPRSGVRHIIKKYLESREFQHFRMIALADSPLEILDYIGSFAIEQIDLARVAVQERNGVTQCLKEYQIESKRVVEIRDYVRDHFNRAKRKLFAQVYNDSPLRPAKTWPMEHKRLDGYLNHINLASREFIGYSRILKAGDRFYLLTANAFIDRLSKTDNAKLMTQLSRLIQKTKEQLAVQMRELSFLMQKRIDGDDDENISISTADLVDLYKSQLYLNIDEVDQLKVKVRSKMNVDETTKYKLGQQLRQWEKAISSEKRDIEKSIRKLRECHEIKEYLLAFKNDIFAQKGRHAEALQSLFLAED